MNELKSPRILDVDIDYILDLDESVKVSVYKSDAIYDVVGGWYKVHGKIYYPDGSYDYYKIRVYRRKRLDEYYRVILNRRGFYEG